MVIGRAWGNSISTVCDWLDSQGLGKYADVFAENAIAWPRMSKLSADDLKELGLNIGERRQFPEAASAPARAEGSMRNLSLPITVALNANNKGIVMKQDLSSASVSINGKDVLVQWTASAARELARRQTPLFVELELYFSCLVKKFVHFHEDAQGRATVAASDKLSLYFRPVTSTACSVDVVDRLGRQPEVELDSDAVRKIAPKSVQIDHARGAWQGAYSM